MTERAKRTRTTTKTGCDEPSGTPLTDGRRSGPAAAAEYDRDDAAPDLDQRERQQKPQRKAPGPARDRRAGGRAISDSETPPTDPVAPTDPE